MKKNRIIFFAIWILSLIGVSFYGGTVSYSLFIFFTAIPVVSFLYLIYVFFTYRIYQEIGTRNLIANKSVPYYITLQNEYPVLFSSIRLSLYSSFSRIEGLDDDAEYELSPKDGIRLETRLICRYRGEYEVGVKKITIIDPFRLIRLSFKNPEPLRVIVKPELIHDASAAESLSAVSFPKASDITDMPDVVVRDYIPGDSIGRINWKVSARMDTLLVRKDTGEGKNGMILIPDTCRYTDDIYEYIPSENEVIKTVLLLTLYYLKQSNPVYLLALQKNGLICITANSENEFLSYYENVSGIIFEKDLSPDAFISALSGNEAYLSENNVTVITPEIADADERPDLLTQYLKKTGKNVSIYRTGGEKHE
ncbi:MAG: DUF58 domain-containing protein [Lachnospiraceae bacterium]|nr:DUF58 domain-containing protein [Lachnospiraceae bacterium]